MNPDTRAFFNKAPTFKISRQNTLAREFFKHLGHFTDDDLKVYVQHLLGITPNRKDPYPKVTVYKTLRIHRSHYSAPEWVERRKRKLIVLQELDELEDSLEFITAEGTVDNEKWRTWKKEHNVSTASWNILLTQIPAAYFVKRLTNEAKLKRACEFKDKFPSVLHFLRGFLRLKNRLVRPGGSAKFRTLNSETMEFGAPTQYTPTRRIPFAVMDLRDTPGHIATEDSTKQAHLSLLIVALKSLKGPSVSTPSIWLWIVNSANRLAQAKENASQTFKNYTAFEAKYIPLKNERLYDLPVRKQSPDVFLLFLVKKGDVEAESMKAKIRSEYRTPEISYYTENGKYSELKYRLRASELRMEFYLDLLHDFCRPGDSFMGVYSGLKCLIAARVCLDTFVLLVRFVDKFQFIQLSSSRR